VHVRQLWLLLAQLPRWGNCNPAMITYMSLNIAAWIYDNAQVAQNLKDDHQRRNFTQEFMSEYQ